MFSALDAFSFDLRTRDISERNNCSEDVYWEIPGIEICNFNQTDEIYLENNFKECATECPEACKSVYYELITESVTENSLGKNMFKLELFFPNFKVYQIIQSPKTEMTDLVSQIGGILGLFIGFKLMGFIDIFEFLLEMIFGIVEMILDIFSNNIISNKL